MRLNSSYDIAAHGLPSNICNEVVGAHVVFPRYGISVPAACTRYHGLHGTVIDRDTTCTQPRLLHIDGILHTV